jgi:transmembrane sensor
MSGERTMKGVDRVTDEAAGWFARLEGEAATAEQWQAFEAWLSASPDNVEAYERLERIWVELETDPDSFLKALDQSALRPAARRARPARGATSSRRGWIVAAMGAIAATVVVGIEVGDNLGVSTQSLVLQAPAGQPRMFRLADGTQINLNAGSVMRVEISRSARRVVMADAEAVFDVTHDSRRPFLITAGDREVRVVGTMFNLRQRGDAMALSVRRGVVEVRPVDSPGAQPVRVTVGQQLAHRRGQGTTLAEDGQAETAFAWTTGQLIYRDQPLSEVAADVSRRFGVPVRTADAATASLRFSGVLVLDSAPDVVGRIEAFAPVRARSTADGIVLSRR